MTIDSPIRSAIEPPVDKSMDGSTSVIELEASYLIDGTDYLVDGVDNKLGDPD